MAIEKLAYRTIEQDGDVELRRIEPHVVAETYVEGDFERVGTEGFRRLVAYIGGANREEGKIAMTAPVGQGPASEKIAMTAPVGQGSASETIAMTAPVGQEKVGERYRITFVMPSKYALEDLPQPTDRRIRLREEPARTVAAIRYTGFWSRSRYEAHERRLLEWIQRRGLESVGEPVWARYDPPFMPWFLRRNEILIELPAPS
ncbi:MAG: heme-binding protein [Myxococcota bacterium]|nr:heme-binding protein [Myxococcota bacterium]